MSTNKEASPRFSLEDGLGSFGARLRWARSRARLTQDQVCALVGMTQGAYSLLEKRGTGSEKTASLARVLHVDPIWLESGAGAPDLPVDQGWSFVEVRLIDLKLSAGASGFAVEYVGGGEPIMFRRSWMESRGFRPERVFAMLVTGQSMEPSLFDGDLVVFNTTDVTPRDGEVYAVNYDGEAVVKRLVRDGGQWWLQSDNADKARFPRKEMTPTSFLVGRVVLKQSERV